MPKVLPVPNLLFVVFYLLPLVIFGVVIVMKLRTVPKEHRTSWGWLLSITFSLAAITMSMMRFPH
jgi:hypothetical protein